MIQLQKIAKEIAKMPNVEFSYYAENALPVDAPVCDRQFEGITDDGANTFFRFLYRGTGYIGVIVGVGEEQKNYARLLPAFIESFADRETDLSKTEHLKRILLGECSSMGVYKYTTRYSVKNSASFALSLHTPRLMQEVLGVLEQYGGNSLDAAVKISETTCVFVKFVEEGKSEYASSVDYAEFLAQSLKEELGLSVQIGVGPTVREFKDISSSYAQAENALRYADVFALPGKVHSYRECILLKILEEVPESKLAEYFTEVTDEGCKEVLGDEEMLATAEAFLQSSLNVSETSRTLYMHRNTLLYRLDKIEKATGLNIRQFSDAVSFRVLTVLHKLLKK